MTVAEKIRAARSEVEDRKPSPAGGRADRLFSIASTKLEEALYAYNHARAIEEGCETAADFDAA